MRRAAAGEAARGALLLLLPAAAGAQVPACAPAADQTLTPAPFSGRVQSPGVGLRKDVVKDQGEGEYDARYLIHGLGDSLGRIYVRLDAFKDGVPLSPDFLRRLDAQLEAARRDGIKVALQFAYNYPCEPRSSHEKAGAFKPTHAVCAQDRARGYPWNDPAFGDADVATILAHVRQLAPVLRENADVIASVAGFVGRWGEQHHSTHGLTAENGRGVLLPVQAEALARIVGALLDAYPGPVVMRYPWQRSAVFADDTPGRLDPRLKGRVGLEDDCFLADQGDAGTYLTATAEGRRPPDLAAFIDVQRRYFADVGAYALTGGEACHLNPPRSDCRTALAELRELHFSYLTDGFPRSVFDRWKAGGCYDFIKSRLGYRLALKSASFPSQGRLGESVALRAVVADDGFAAPVGARPVEAVLRCGARPLAFQPLAGVDASAWAPGRETDVAAAFRLPADFAGACEVGLALPDGCDPGDPASTDPVEAARAAHCRRVRADPRYGAQLAGARWDAEAGVSWLGSIAVSPSPLPPCR